MPKNGLYEVVIPADRWSIRAVSPIDIRDGVSANESRHTLLINPGWLQDPIKHCELMTELADNDCLPIAVDTINGYADRQLEHSARYPLRLLQQRYVTGTSNPYFDIEKRSQNRWEYRRATALLYVCQQLGITKRSYAGHSEGGRIVTQAALASMDMTEHLIIVNGAGTGDSSNGYVRIAKYNAHRAADLLRGDSSVSLRSALGSFLHTVTHPHRTLREKHVIQSTDLWQHIDEFEHTDVSVTVLHALLDELVTFEDSYKQARLRPWVKFIETEGNHNNVYGPAVRKLIAKIVAGS